MQEKVQERKSSLRNKEMKTFTYIYRDIMYVYIYIFKKF